MLDLYCPAKTLHYLPRSFRQAKSFDNMLNLVYASIGLSSDSFINRFMVMTGADMVLKGGIQVSSFVVKFGSVY